MTGAQRREDRYKLSQQAGREKSRCYEYRSARMIMRVDANLQAEKAGIDGKYKEDIDHRPSAVKVELQVGDIYQYNSY